MSYLLFEFEWATISVIAANAVTGTPWRTILGTAWEVVRG